MCIRDRQEDGEWRCMRRDLLSSARLHAPTQSRQCEECKKTLSSTVGQMQHRISNNPRDLKTC
eukprot:10262260-Prorocentrum_lima.AAC.1